MAELVVGTWNSVEISSDVGSLDHVEWLTGSVIERRTWYFLTPV